MVLAAMVFAAPSHAGQAASQPARTPPEELPLLTTARQAHHLSSMEAARAYPIHLRRAVVTYFDPSVGDNRSYLFIHDATEGIYAELAKGSTRNLPPGTLIDIRGVSDPGEFSSIIAQPQIKVIGRSSLPPNPSRPSLTRLVTGVEDSEWVEVEGLIHSVVEQGHNVILQLAMDGGTVSVVLVKEAGAKYSGLTDARVRIRATASPMFNESRQGIGVRLMCPNLSAIKILEAPLQNPFDLPITPVDKLLRWDQVEASFHRMHLNGKVTLQWPGSMLCIHDEMRGICAQTVQRDHVALGDEVDVVGFEGAEDSAPVLTNAVFRKRNGSNPVVPERVSAEQALFSRHDSELVQIDGQLVGKDVDASDVTLLLSSGTTIFTAVLPRELAEANANAWKIGSILRVTGICSVRLDAQKSAVGEGKAVPKSFRILMRSPQDAAILKSPSWWTAGHALVLLGVAMAATLLVLTWVWILRNRVEEQTHLIRESEERFRQMAMHDYLTGLATRTLLQDRLNIAVESVRRRKTGMALLILDVDKFKQVNDTFGHLAGDEVLRVTACRLLETVRKSDTVARFGGDEFVVLLPDLNEPQAAEKIAENIVRKLENPILFKDRMVPVSVSIGLSIAFAAAVDADILLRNADRALYYVKAHGRNGFRVFTPDMASDWTV